MKKNSNHKRIYNKTLARVNFSMSKTASEKIVNDIDKFKINQTSQSNLKIDIFSKYLHLKNYIKKKTNYKNKNSNIKYTRRTVSEKLGGGIFSSDINKYVQTFKKINKNSGNIKIRSFGPNGFYISKK